MIRISRFGLTLGLLATLAIGACGGDGADTGTETSDTTGAVGTPGIDSTMHYTPADSGLPTNADSNSTSGADQSGPGDPGVDSAGASSTPAGGSGASGSGGGTELAGMVKAQVEMMHPNVTVTSSGAGEVTLGGTVASAQEKSEAEAEAKKVVGVKSVKNEIAVR